MLDTNNSVVAYANWFQFGRGERIDHNRVESRTLLWCEMGYGNIRVNSQWLEFSPDTFVLLPWGHTITYQAAAQSPFLVGAVHVIPFHHPGVPMEFMTAHHPADRLSAVPWRQDINWERLTGLCRGSWEPPARPRRLAKYIADRFQETPPDEYTFRTLARLLMLELHELLSHPVPPSYPAPALLKQIQEYAKGHLTESLEVNSLAQVANCSPATVHRMFESIKDTPAQWIARLRLQRAEYLLRTTTLSVGDVGASIGLYDPFHFSRFFKRHTGVSPRAYREQLKLV